MFALKKKLVIQKKPIKAERKFIKKEAIKEFFKDCEKKKLIIKASAKKIKNSNKRNAIK